MTMPSLSLWRHGVFRLTLRECVCGGDGVMRISRTCVNQTRNTTGDGGLASHRMDV
eukprot:CAMPEP_0116550424 /NCGR_PEP_ID=MMETSP0397-20121206/5420_1 /TAXON_ID=216820 /ORGANISM="Cyclophora tenuis, Strain ECT3854" /LENGTH=55 /DNA_ID=CAMNT_0004075255 /DNA_START=896 /DNA_END=1059 /DNA_ORIENTATION=+